jgi:hypothetical protein
MRLRLTASPTWRVDHHLRMQHSENDGRPRLPQWIGRHGSGKLNGGRHVDPV